LLLAALLGGTAQARGVSPYLPLQQSPEIERKIERLLMLADQPVMTRPIAAATVFDALPKACTRDAALCDEVRRYLSSYMRTSGLTHASAAVAGNSGAAQAAPNRHGMATDSDYEVSVGGYWQPSDYAIINAGVLAYTDESTPTGSVVSLGTARLQLDVGYRDHWWSPLTDSAMTLSTEAATLPSITVSNYLPLTKWNFRYEAFLGELDESINIVDQSGTMTGRPRLAGLHLSIQPLPGWALGVSRVLQYGGGGREDSFGDLLDAFLNPSDNDNAGANDPNEFGNQVASITSRFTVQDPLPFAVYFEYAGEDTSTLSNFKLGNVALSAGIDFPSLWRNLALTVEVSEWQNTWYDHHIYRDGLRYQDRVLGHWGADWRVTGDPVGARSWFARLGWPPRFGGWLETSYRQIDNESYGEAPYDTGRHLEARYSRPWQQFYVGAELMSGRDVFGESYSRFGAFVRF
jgi:hypothetical protein